MQTDDLNIRSPGLMVHGSLLMKILNKILPRLYCIMEHLKLDEHVHVHVDQIAVENEVIFCFVYFFVERLKQLRQILKQFLVLNSVIEVVFVFFELLFCEFFEARKCPVTLSIDQVLLLSHLQKLNLLFVVLLKEGCLGEPVGGRATSIQLLTRLRILDVRLLGLVILATLLVKFGSRLKMHRSAQMIGRPLQKTGRRGRLALFEVLVGLLNLISVLHVFLINFDKN